MTETISKKHEIADLENLYNEAEAADSEVFSEMRSNVLLISGEHYNRRQSNFFKRLRQSNEINEQQKIRLTKNHIQKIVKLYANNIISMAPGVAFTAANESEASDQKAAEIHHAVWQWAKQKYNLDELIDDECDNFVGIGECAIKIFYDDTGGNLIGHRQEMSEGGQPAFNEDGQPVLGEPVFEGGFIFEQIHAFNLFRDPSAKSMNDSEFLGIRKMISKEKLIQKYPDKKKFFQDSSDQTMVVFDQSRGGYRKSEGEVMVKEYFFKSCAKYPRGYYFFTTREGIFADGELPGGIFPIVYQPFDKVPTSPRGRSPVKIMRPYQAEINRAASKMAEHQITLGDDKILLQNNTKLSSGTALPGIRGINYTGAEPVILAGRNGAQYLDYMNAQIAELYQVMSVAEDADEKDGNIDPFALLFKAASQKRKFQRYIKRFERYLVGIATLFTKLAKHHLPDDAVIMATGRKELVNISEFRQTGDLSYQIKINAQSEDIETKMGKQLMLNNLIQYTGGKLEKEDLGKLIRLMPYMNLEEGASDFTLDYDNSVNEILALERGELPQVHEYDTHVYMAKRLVSRMRQADFRFFPPEIQQNFQTVKAQHEQTQAEQAQKIKAMQSEFIPTGGYMVVVDLYVSDPTNPAKTRRARLPYESVQWLIKQLEVQGQGLDQLEAMNEGMVADLADKLIQKRQGMPSEGMQQPAPQQDM